MTSGYVPTKQVSLQMTSASRLSPNVHLALQHIIRNFFRIENVVWTHYDNDVNPGFQYYTAEGTAMNIYIYIYA